MLIKIHPDTPSDRKIRSVVDILENGGVVIYPTDSVYAIGCDINRAKSVERIAKLKGLKPEKANFSIICFDLSHLSDYTSHVDNHIFKLMKKSLPGPFTFILNANSNVPRLFKSTKKTIGIRIPDNNIVREIVRILGRPLVTTSVRDDDEVIEYTTDPELIYDRYRDQVDAVIDGGYGNNEASTVVDCTGDEIEIIRQGIGELDL
ncbi:MAG: threonylcarbamoyl-AMP synthase [Bacteroidetes bacterium]|nr:threonylcarbamoyl-AMP synthase [Bacteroidota bacterium]